MKIIGIGVDIVKNKRVALSIKNKTFINRTFGKNEILQNELFFKTFCCKRSFC